MLALAGASDIDVELDPAGMDKLDVGNAEPEAALLLAIAALAYNVSKISPKLV